MIKKIKFRPDEMRHIRQAAQIYEESAEEYIKRAVKMRIMAESGAYYINSRNEVGKFKPDRYFYAKDSLYGEEIYIIDDSYYMPMKRLYIDKAEAEREAQRRARREYVPYTPESKKKRWPRDEHGRLIRNPDGTFKKE